MNLDITQATGAAAVAVVLAVFVVAFWNGGQTCNRYANHGSSFSHRVKGTVYTP